MSGCSTRGCQRTPRPNFAICDDCIEDLLRPTDPFLDLIESGTATFDRPAPRRAADTDFAGAGALTAETGVGGSLEVPDGRLATHAGAECPLPPRTSAGVASLHEWAPGSGDLAGWEDMEKRFAWGDR